MKKDVYLVVQVIRVGRLLYAESSKKLLNQKYRRPYAVAVLSLAELLSEPNLSSWSEEREFSLKLYQSDEKDYGLWQHELAAKKPNSKFSLLSGQVSHGNTQLTFLRVLFFLFFFLCFGTLFTLLLPYY